MSEIDDKISRRLERWPEKEEIPPELAEFYRRLLKVQSDADKRVGPPSPVINTEAIDSRLEGGLPLIFADEMDLDWSLVREIFDKVITLFSEYDKLFGEIPSGLIELTDSPLLRDVVAAQLTGTDLAEISTIGHIDGLLLENIIQVTLRPFLISYAEILKPYVVQERWRRGYCPVCGGNPDFAYLEKEYGARWLVCCRCDTEWLFQRLQCPYCGNQDQDKLAYYANDDGLYRLYICEQCKRYLKTIDLRRTDEVVDISLERFFTLGLDMQAREYGYDRD